MGIKNILGKLDLLDEEPDKVSPSKPAPRVSSNETQPVFSVSTERPAQMSPVSSEPDKGYVETLKTALAESQVPGFEEFTKQLKVIEAVPGMDEATRFRTVVAILASSGVGRDGVIRSIEDRRNLLASKRVEFDQAIQARRETQLGSKESEKRSTEQQIQARRAEIAALEDKLRKIEDEARNEESKLSRATVAFSGAYTYVEDELSSLLSKLTSYTR